MWEKELWIARRKKIETNDMGVDTEIFYPPIRYMINYQPINDNNSYQEYGEHIVDVYRAFVTTMLYQGKINVGDRAYMSDGQTLPNELKNLVESDDEYCNNANYVVRVVLPQNFFTRVDFLKRR